MALTRAVKTDKVKKLASELEGSTSAIIGTFSGLTASKDFELRKAVRGAGGSYHVVKNKLAARAAEGTKIEAALKGLKGVSSVAYTSGDPVALAKALSTWVKDNAEFTFKLGIIDGKVIDVREIGELATMPGKEELFSKLLFLIQSPAQRLATVINATGRDLAVVINQGVEKEKFAAPAQSAPSKAEAAAEEKSEKAEEKPEKEAPAKDESEASAGEKVAEAHIEEAAAGEQPSGAEQPENSTATQGGEAATTDPVEG
ncbi:50S ribosomal protein L10 [Edaphobacter paludis]|uniref:Large ribosomal subunit protein uL10 n=1 Tax=Edaphobacter paludis TaxID=3035702 RepID=A0AAU7D4F0_9BACT